MKRLLLLVVAVLIYMPSPLAAREGVVKGSYINLRSESNFKAPIVGKKVRGQKYKVLFEEKGWLKVKFNDGMEAWIFETITTMPYLMRAHAFKDAEAKNKEINVGVFNYPMLMAADILIQDADAVPVGQDQRQHIEISRDTAEKFNRIFGETFKVPVSYILENVATVPGTDGQKMSKGYNNTIPLFATNEEIEKAVLSIVTDSGIGKPENVYAIHTLFREKKELDELYSEKQGKYKELKEALIEDMKTFVRPLREKRAEFEKDKGRVLEIIKQGGEVARQRAEKKMEEVREKVGFKLH